MDVWNKISNYVNKPNLFASTFPKLSALYTLRYVTKTCWLDLSYTIRGNVSEEITLRGGGKQNHQLTDSDHSFWFMTVRHSVTKKNDAVLTRNYQLIKSHTCHWIICKSHWIICKKERKWDWMGEKQTFSTLLHELVWDIYSLLPQPCR